jgi:hypothetical protein
MLKITIHIDDETRKSIKNTYGKDDFDTVNSVVYDIINRYLNVEHFDPKLNMDGESDDRICEFCGEKSKHSRMIDTNGTNLEEHDVCKNCGSGYPALA